jgi:voltage-gated potassium channel Kch
MAVNLGATDEAEYQQLNRYFMITLTVSVFLLATGAIFYHIVEKLAWLDAVYFCVITLTTIGYGDIVPHTNLGKLFTIFYVLGGVGIIATLLNLMVRRAALKRGRRRSKD